MLRSGQRRSTSTVPVAGNPCEFCRPSCRPVNLLAESTCRIQQLLARQNIDSAVIGAMAVGVYGVARATADVDLKVLLGRDEAERLATVLEQNGYKILGGKAIELLQQYGMVFATDPARIRVDFLLSDIEFDRSAILAAVQTDLGEGRWARVLWPFLSRPATGRAAAPGYAASQAPDEGAGEQRQLGGLRSAEWGHSAVRVVLPCASRC